MTQESVLLGTQVANIVEQVWKPEFGLLANEEKVCTRGFSGADGVKKVGKTLNVSKIAAVTTQTLSPTAAAYRANLIFDNQTQSNLSSTAVRIYTGIQIPRSVETQLLRYPNFIEGYKSQLVKSLIASIDVAGAQLASGFTTNILGGAGQDITEALLTSAIAKLSLSAKEYFSPGVQRGYLSVYPLQVDNILQIDKAVNAYIRGDSANPVVKGWVWDVYNMDLMDSGNVYTSGGIAYNFLHIPQALILAYNEEPNPIPEQPNGLSTTVLATAEYVVIKFFDEYNVLIQTQTV